MKDNCSLKKTGELFGFFIMFMIVTIVLYFSLQLSHRLPIGWGYIHIFLLVLSVVLTGILIKLLLK
jgi:hypothetical protein